VTPERAPAPRSAAHAEAQRERILDAAQKRFIEQGFHAATMADIAETASMSAGLIYRYFEGKDAIVLAIIDRELQRRRARIAALHSSADFVDGLVEAFRELRGNETDPFNAALFLEMSAEATRVPRIAQAMEAADRITRDEFVDWLARPREAGGYGLARPKAEIAALRIQIIVEGLAVRSAREPGLDCARLRQALAPVFQRLE
jgi:AcrR family transcriptional regulator